MTTFSCITRFGVTEDEVEDYVRTMVAWRMTAGNVKRNSWGIQILVNATPGANTNHDELRFGYTKPGAEHDADWYMANATGKNVVCLATGMDSHETVRVRPGMLAGVNGAFPWGGAIIDDAYGLCIGFSGCKEDEDILIVRDVRNWLAMRADRAGQSLL